jgi:D-tyrosyl-tRNA(Tyr) deacylase
VRAVVQRVARAGATPGGAIESGVCVLLGVAREDDDAVAERLAGKVARLRIFENDDGKLPPPSAASLHRLGSTPAASQPALPSASKLDLSLLDVGGAALVVSQFTLIADTARGTRPSFSGAARPELAEPLYERFAQALRDLGVEVATGVFGARMQVELANDGPVTSGLDLNLKGFGRAADRRWGRGRAKGREFARRAPSTEGLTVESRR